MKRAILPRLVCGAHALAWTCTGLIFFTIAAYFAARDVAQVRSDAWGPIAMMVAFGLLAWVGVHGLIAATVGRPGSVVVFHRATLILLPLACTAALWSAATSQDHQLGVLLVAFDAGLIYMAARSLRRRHDTKTGVESTRGRGSR